jgi:SAM-dependent methyltransferase
MDQQQIKAHWKDWAERYGLDLRATTKAWTAKALEIDALARAIHRAGLSDKVGMVLEAGCGNGHNCIELARRFPKLSFTGFDYVADMVRSARQLLAQSDLGDRVEFYEGDVLSLESISELGPQYDFVFTDRCLINLNSIEKQLAAIDQLCTKLPVGGCMVLIENSRQTYERQNDCREIVGLPRRTPAAFNLFLDEAVVIPYLRSRFARLEVEDFSSLHDLVLYVLLPAVNGGQIDYEHPLVHAATRLTLGFGSSEIPQFGTFGQNRLFFCSGRT